MADQDWKTGGLNRKKYVVLKSCPTCDGSGELREGYDIFCKDCGGTGAVRPKDENAQYFVLRIDCGPDGARDPNARSALLHYAKHVRIENSEFANDILGWLDETAEVAK